MKSTDETYPEEIKQNEYTVCEKTFTKKLLHEKHNKIYNCKDCGKCFSSKHGLRLHQMYHQPFTSLECEKVNVSSNSNERGKSFTQEDHLHRFHEESSDEPRFPCEKCGMTFTRKFNLKKHVDGFRCPNGRDKLKCPKCADLFTRKADFNAHTRSQHPDICFKCTECDNIFTSRVDLNNHTKRHVRKNFECTECGETFTQIIALNSHLRLHYLQKHLKESTVPNEDLENNQTPALLARTSSDQNEIDQHFQQTRLTIQLPNQIQSLPLRLRQNRQSETASQIPLQTYESTSSNVPVGSINLVPKNSEMFENFSVKIEPSLTTAPQIPLQTCESTSSNEPVGSINLVPENSEMFENFSVKIEPSLTTAPQIPLQTCESTSSNEPAGSINLVPENSEIFENFSVKIEPSLTTAPQISLQTCESTSSNLPAESVHLVPENSEIFENFSVKIEPSLATAPQIPLQTCESTSSNVPVGSVQLGPKNPEILGNFSVKIEPSSPEASIVPQEPIQLITECQEQPLNHQSQPSVETTSSSKMSSKEKLKSTKHQPRLSVALRYTLLKQHDNRELKSQKAHKIKQSFVRNHQNQLQNFITKQRNLLKHGQNSLIQNQGQIPNMRDVELDITDKNDTITYRSKNSKAS
uniref:C2H2-type domain-containing protein n=1 Tax=Clytia hemisphaerica TaxID=252671 RepID=A0A7M5XFI2_9CNID